ncbi:Very-long-chain enoyl-CoA reductase [Trichinella pseudospiralis]|uniref:Very-long-chain enoyl-CoA reductase n=1 Tax=Trichinella pseudospiralis TaxID=6337 RepID=A0A0V1EST1_TRIPS|nr:Very-long-chain enoyl-CoA reductase [Trichinella pseudospiralis]KRZ19717.1 Very-long-chain enoyl-CoA reductase [Trichinella pseudospiralis]
MSFAEIEIYDCRTLRMMLVLRNLPETATILDVKHEVTRKKPGFAVESQSLRLQSTGGKNLSDECKLDTLPKIDGRIQLYVKDLGPQVQWKTVFLLEYIGPLIVYPIFFFRLPFIYEYRFTNQIPTSWIVRLALGCWTLHYLKRVCETLYVHKFSHSTMPLRNLFKNCAYYWGFAAFVGYHVNHPFYTEPKAAVALIGLVGFLLAELGNYSIHAALSNLRPVGSKERKIPMPTENPFTLLFNLVSVPNYTYEIIAWFCFSMMTQCLPALLFTILGAIQMTIWACAKQKAYKREFPCYPAERKAIIPFLI